MIGQRELAFMKPSAILVNCARGGTVDERALALALKEERIWGAVLDAVLDVPPTLEKQGVLLECERAVIMPHVGASTRENQSRSGDVVVEVLRGGVEGGGGVGGEGCMILGRRERKGGKPYVPRQGGRYWIPFKRRKVYTK